MCVRERERESVCERERVCVRVRERESQHTPLGVECGVLVGDACRTVPV